MIKQKWKERLLKNLSAPPVEEEQALFDRVQIATCVILLEVAKYDNEFSSIEEETTKARASGIIKLESNGLFKIIRE